MEAALVAVGLLVGAGVAWFLVVKYAWPEEIEHWADSGSEKGGE